MGLLDYADSARKKLAGLLGDMPLVQIAQGRAEMPTMGGLLASLKSMPVFSPDAGQSAYEAALNIGPMGLGKIVYHGSPHKFDKFDASKIGTGEGAQAYGHGVYLADSPGVAGGYAEKLSDAQGNIPLIQARQDAINTFKKRIASGGDAALYGPQIKQLEWEIADLSKNLNTGQLYKADLPDEWIPKMLDWDRPLKDQGEVLSALQNSGYLDEARKAGGFYESDIASGLMEGRHILPAKPSAGGKDVAEKLRRAGIPGIRYLDGGSRPKNIIDADLLKLYEKHGGNAQRAVDEFMGHVYESPKEKARMAAQFMKQLENAPTYNYVVFPGLEDQVKILERNGVPLSGLLGGQ